VASDETDDRQESAGTDDRASDGIVGDALAKVGNLAGDIGRLGAAWIELARAEVAVARLSAIRLLFAAAAVTALSLMTWVFACLALVWWLNSMGVSMSGALALVAGLNLSIIVVLALLMRRWRRALQMTDSRAALADIARTLSP
jgi:hypothetical protein